MPLLKERRHTVDAGAAGADDKTRKSKRQRFADLFRRRTQKQKQKQQLEPEQDGVVRVRPLILSLITPLSQSSQLMAPARSKIPVAVSTTDQTAPRKPARDSKPAEATKPGVNSPLETTGRASGVDPAEQAEQAEQKTQPPSPPPTEPQPEPKQEQQQAEPLSEGHVHSLFSGAPHFSISKNNARPTPSAAYLWDSGLAARDVSDSLPLAQPAFSAVTLHRHLPKMQQAAEQDKKYRGYNLEVVEMPSMLSAQGTEPGSVGMAYFLEMAKSDNLVTDTQQSQSSNGFLEAVRNKEQMQSSPEKLGIRFVDMELVYDRLVEFGDLYELFHDSPERMTILNNQSSGDLYTNLFGKFLTPPRYDDSVHDPTGIKVQIDTLLNILRLKGVWYDFSLVEWRIRLGQILWSDPDSLTPPESQQLWTERDILLLQITLACELLLRLDAVTSMDADDVKSQMHVRPQDFEGFLNLKTRKTEWDLVLARRFLENILVVRENYMASPADNDSKPRGLFSMLSKKEPKEEEVKPDIIMLPQHQARQLSGLLYFAETIKWPGIELILNDLVKKLDMLNDSTETETQPSSPYGRFVDPTTPSSISVYGTPLVSPRSPNGMLDSYFGNVTKPQLNRNDSSSMRLPLSSTLLAHAEEPANSLNIGGWLSRSYLTGFILPGEASMHFLMSTLLENDKAAISALGDSANLYGGFIYSGRTWWSKSSIVGRVLACTEGSVECMGWVSFTKLPAGVSDGWYAISSEQLHPEQSPRLAAEEDPVAQDSAITPTGTDNVKAEDLSLPVDASERPVPSVEFTEWKLALIKPGLAENDTSSDLSSEIENETYIASVTFKSYTREDFHTFTLTNDVHFITSWPCTAPTASPSPSLPHIVKRSSAMQTLSRSSSRSGSAGARLSRHPSRRNSHGFEPLLSHPPDSPGVLPQRLPSPIPDDEPKLNTSTTNKPEPMKAHPLHVSYKYKIVLSTEILDDGFVLPFPRQEYTSPTPTPQATPQEEKDEAAPKEDTKTVLVLDARASKDLELLTRAWCAEKGLHAIISRSGRTCLSCSIREARGLGVNIVIRV